MKTYKSNERYHHKENYTVHGFQYIFKNLIAFKIIIEFHALVKIYSSYNNTKEWKDTIVRAYFNFHNAYTTIYNNILILQCCMRTKTLVDFRN